VFEGISNAYDKQIDISLRLSYGSRSCEVGQVRVSLRVGPVVSKMLIVYFSLRGEYNADTTHSTAEKVRAKESGGDSMGLENFSM
jgi:hypothetical protein